MTKILLTGAAGFAGSHIAEEIIKNTDWNIIGLDCLTYAGRLDRLAGIPSNRLEFINHDFRFPFTDKDIPRFHGVDFIIHNGGETHVMRSLADPAIFIQSNVMGTVNMLELARRIAPKYFIYVSTDEVFGPSSGIAFCEQDRLAPTNPYAASKASGEMVARSYCRCFKVPVIITRTMNMFGERQHPEKFVPMTIWKVLTGKKVVVHTRELFAGREIGSRQWLHAKVQADALLFLLRQSGLSGQTFHIAGMQKNNFEIAQRISEIMHVKLDAEFLDISAVCPSHDLHYSINDSKIRNLGWYPKIEFDEAFEHNVHWTLSNPKWMEAAQ
jgi:dTDP-glucose 4,6-dehydratase